MFEWKVVVCEGEEGGFGGGCGCVREWIYGWIVGEGVVWEIGCCSG